GTPSGLSRTLPEVREVPGGGITLRRCIRAWETQRRNGDVELSVSPSTALMGRDARSDRSRSGPLHSLGNRETEPFGEAGVAPVIHVQPIRRYEPFERQMFSLVPMPHQIEAAKMI